MDRTYQCEDKPHTGSPVLPIGDQCNGIDDIDGPRPTLIGDQCNDTDDIDGPRPTPVNIWPQDGDNVRLASKLSHKRDGYLQVTKKKIPFSDLMVDAKGGVDKKNSLFKIFWAQGSINSSGQKSKKMRDELRVWIGIPGDRVGKNENTVYMLQTPPSGDKIAVKDYKLKESRPDVPDNVDESSLSFVLQYEGGNTFAIRDNLDDGHHHYVTSNGNGKVTRVRRNSWLNQEEYVHPGMQFTMMPLGKETDLSDGE